MVRTFNKKDEAPDNAIKNHYPSHLFDEVAINNFSGLNEINGPTPDEI